LDRPASSGKNPTINRIDVGNVTKMNKATAAMLLAC